MREDHNYVSADGTVFHIAHRMQHLTLCGTGLLSNRWQIPVSEAGFALKPAFFGRIRLCQECRIAHNQIIKKERPA